MMYHSDLDLSRWDDQHLMALRTVDKSILSCADMRLTLSVVLDRVLMTLQADLANILMLDAETQQLHYAIHRGWLPEEVHRVSLRLGEGLAGRVAQEGRAIILRVKGYQGEDERIERMLHRGVSEYCAVPLVSRGETRGVLEVFFGERGRAGRNAQVFLETLAGQAAIAIDNYLLAESLRRFNTEMTLAYESTIEGWSRALDLRDRETQDHSRRVTEMTLRLARAIGMSEEELIHVRRGALLHDIGKMGVPDSILMKPGLLTWEEMEIVRQHPTFAFKMLAPIDFLRRAIDIPYCHHERWDGTGYPRGLKGEEIPLAARIFAVADVWDALTSDRPYRCAWPEERVRRHIASRAGTHFDPKIVKVFLAIQDQESEGGEASGIALAA